MIDRGLLNIHHEIPKLLTVVTKRFLDTVFATLKDVASHCAQDETEFDSRTS